MLSLTLALLLTQTPKIAAPAWTAVEVSQEKTAFFAARFAAALRARELQVITAEDISALLGVERQRQLLGCSEDASSCMLELGAALGAQQILTGTVAKFETSYKVNLRVLRSSDGVVVAQADASAPSQETLLFALDDAAISIAKQLESPRGRLKRSLALIPAIIGGVFLAAGTIGFLLASSTSAELDQKIALDTVASQLTPIVRRGEAFEALGWSAVGLAGAAGATALVMYLLGAPPETSVTLAPLPSGAVLGLGGAF